jgi:hypothetical protein
VIATSILPAVVLSLSSDLVLLGVCILALHFTAIRIPVALILISTALDIFTSIDLLRSGVETLGIHIPWIPWAGLLPLFSKPVVFVGEFLNLLGIAGLALKIFRNPALAPID